MSDSEAVGCPSFLSPEIIRSQDTFCVGSPSSTRLAVSRAQFEAAANADMLAATSARIVSAVGIRYLAEFFLLCWFMLGRASTMQV